jgi:hypothetical protein
MVEVLIVAAGVLVVVTVIGVAVATWRAVRARASSSASPAHEVLDRMTRDGRRPGEGVGDLPGSGDGLRAMLDRRRASADPNDVGLAGHE